MLHQMAMELVEFIKDSKGRFDQGWVPVAFVKKELQLNFPAVPRQNMQYREKGWLFAILARLLEDKNLVEYDKRGNRAYYRPV